LRFQKAEISTENALPNMMPKRPIMRFSCKAVLSGYTNRLSLTVYILLVLGSSSRSHAQADTTTYQHCQIIVFNSEGSRKALQPNYVFLFPSRLQSEADKIESLGIVNSYDVVDKMESSGWRLVDTGFLIVPSVGINLHTTRFYFRGARFHKPQKDRF
jgi:hypothetical protein